MNNFLKILKGIWTFLNNNWVVYSTGLIISTFVVPQIFLEGWKDKGLEILSIVAKGILVISCIVFVLVIVYRIFKFSFLIKFKDESPFIAVNIFLKMLHLLRKKWFTLQLIESKMGEIKNYNEHSYYQLIPAEKILEGVKTFSINQKTRIIYKIPVGDFLPLVDLIDLRFIRKLISSGANVIIILIDVPYMLKNEPTINIERITNYTKKIIRRLLGDNVTIYKLSTLFSKDIESSLKFLFTKYIPLYAEKIEKVPKIQNNQKDNQIIFNISYMVFFLLLNSLNYLGIKKSYSFIMIQWNERMTKWDDFKKEIAHTFPELNISYFLAGDNFNDAWGNKIHAFEKSADFFIHSMNETEVELKRKLLAFDTTKEGKWVIPDKYLLYLMREVMGYPNDKLEKQLERLTNNPEQSNLFLRTFSQQEKVEISSEIRRSILLRFIFFIEYLRIQRRLLF